MQRSQFSNLGHNIIIIYCYAVNITKLNKNEERMKHEQGFSLLEVLIATVVLTVGMLSVAALQLTALKNNNATYVRNQAVILVSDMAERIRANLPPEVPTGTPSTNAYSATANPFSTCTAATFGGAACNDPAPDCDGDQKNKTLPTTTCNHSQLAAWDLANWKRSLVNPNIMPLGAIGNVQGCPTGAVADDVSRNGHGSCVISVFWRELSSADNPTSLCTIPANSATLPAISGSVLKCAIITINI